MCQRHGRMGQRWNREIQRRLMEPHLHRIMEHASRRVRVRMIGSSRRDLVIALAIFAINWKYDSLKADNENTRKTRSVGIQYGPNR